MAKRIERVEIVARPRGRGRKKRTGILAYHKFTKGGRVAGRIVYPQQPDGRRPTEYLPGAYESDEMMAAYNRSMGHWLTHKTLPPWVAEKKRRRRHYCLSHPPLAALPWRQPPAPGLCMVNYAPVVKNWTGTCLAPGAHASRTPS